MNRPEQIAKRKAGHPRSSVKADAMVDTALRLDPEVLVAIKATGAG